MRSRYTAYVIADTNYIIKTTHTENNDYKENKTLWKKEILDFSHNYSFKKLTIIEFLDGIDCAYVTFTATIFHNINNESFTEKSMFKKLNNQWLYHSGIHL